MRVFVTIVVPLILPTVLYILYLAALRRRFVGQEPGAPAPEGRRIPWLWLALAGGLLTLVTFLAVAKLEDAPPGSHYEPARVIDGVIQPGRLE
ncbi:MAG: hypothetical protein IRY94_19225 [Rhodospirillaceae bacterium]|nr:hypothetical protein [Rhodospirillaceae bacterium]